MDTRKLTHNNPEFFGSEESRVFVFMLPPDLPDEFCFGGGIHVDIVMVDWFRANPIDPHSEEQKYKTREAMKNGLLKFIKCKQYIYPQMSYLVMTTFGDSWTFVAEMSGKDYHEKQRESLTE